MLGGESLGPIRVIGPVEPESGVKFMPSLEGAHAADVSRIILFIKMGTISTHCDAR